MIYHNFRCSLRPDVTDEQLTAAIAEIQAQAGTIEVLRQFVAGREIGGDFDLGGVFVFDDFADFQAYASHPAHDRIVEIITPLVANVVMFETTDDPDPDLEAKLATLYPNQR